MNNFKKGDKILVECEVIEPCENLMKVTKGGRDNWFWVGRWKCRPVETVPAKTICVGDIENKIATASEMNAKTKQCIIDYFADYINARAKKGYSNWWTRESHIVNSKHIVAVLEHFKDKGYETELASDDVTISW
jgi:hypothetical protein